MKTLRDLVESGLRAGGFDGLCNNFAGCACWVDDLFPCGEPSGECEAGHAGPCNGACEFSPCDGHIYTDLESLQDAKRGEAERLADEATE